jgi:hypothetical protein
MARWLSNILKGRSIDLRENLDSNQLETLIENTPEAQGNIEIKYTNISIISEKLSLMKLYEKLKKGISRNESLETEHEIYSNTNGNQKHYLDIIIKTGDVKREARITYITEFN